MAGRDDTSAYLRGKLRLSGIGDDTDLADACDVLTVLLSDGVPGEALTKLRRSVDRAAWKIRPPDRSTWGLTPEQQAAAARLAAPH